MSISSCTRSVFFSGVPVTSPLLTSAANRRSRVSFSTNSMLSRTTAGVVSRESRNAFRTLNVLNTSWTYASSSSSAGRCPARPFAAALWAPVVACFSATSAPRFDRHHPSAGHGHFTLGKHGAGSARPHPLQLGQVADRADRLQDLDDRPLGRLRPRRHQQVGEGAVGLAFEHEQLAAGR